MAASPSNRSSAHALTAHHLHGRRFVLLGILAGLLALANLAYTRQVIVSGSMTPTIAIGQTVWADRIPGWLHRTPQREDITLFAPIGPYSPESSWTHRVVALPGDKVEVRGGTVLVNGRPTAHPGTTDADAPAVTVPAGMYYQKGDDPDAWNGLVPASAVRGRVLVAGR